MKYSSGNIYPSNYFKYINQYTFIECQYVQE